MFLERGLLPSISQQEHSGPRSLTRERNSSGLKGVERERVDLTSQITCYTKASLHSFMDRESFQFDKTVQFLTKDFNLIILD